MQKKRMKRYKTYERVVSKNSEGSSEVTYVPVGEIEAIISPATSKTAIEMYGAEIKDILNALSFNSIDVLNGLAIYSTNTPDYIIDTKKHYSSHYSYTLKRINNAKL